MQIQDKVFIVTGASSGIGLSTATALTAQGAKVALLARSKEALKSLSQNLPESLPLVVDVTRFEDLKDAIDLARKHYGQIDGLINNAGRGYEATIEEIDPKLFHEIYDLNVLAPIIAIQSVIPAMRNQGGGAIVNVNSGTAFMTIPHCGVYSSSKKALLGISLTARAELLKDNIIISEVYPYITATNFGYARMGNRDARIPAANYAAGDQPEYVAEMILKAIEEGNAQYFANEDLRKLAGA